MRITIKSTPTKNPLLELTIFMYTTKHYNYKVHYWVFGRLLGR